MHHPSHPKSPRKPPGEQSIKMPFSAPRAIMTDEMRTKLLRHTNEVRKSYGLQPVRMVPEYSEELDLYLMQKAKFMGDTMCAGFCSDNPDDLMYMFSWVCTKSTNVVTKDICADTLVNNVDLADEIIRCSNFPTGAYAYVLVKPECDTIAFAAVRIWNTMHAFVIAVGAPWCATPAGESLR